MSDQLTLFATRLRYGVLLQIMNSPVCTRRLSHRQKMTDMRRRFSKTSEDYFRARLDIDYVNKEGLQVASVGSRFTALMIDHLILPLLLVPLFISLSQAQTRLDISTLILFVVALGIGILLYFGYFTILEWRFGQTIGKKLMDIKVIDESGKPITFEQSKTRNFARHKDGFLNYLLGYLTIRDNDMNQRIGDLRANTIVVDQGGQ